MPFFYQNCSITYNITKKMNDIRHSKQKNYTLGLYFKHILKWADYIYYY